MLTMVSMLPDIIHVPARSSADLCSIPDVMIDLVHIVKPVRTHLGSRVGDEEGVELDADIPWRIDT